MSFQLLDFLVVMTFSHFFIKTEQYDSNWPFWHLNRIVHVENAESFVKDYVMFYIFFSIG